MPGRLPERTPVPVLGPRRAPGAVPGPTSGPAAGTASGPVTGTAMSRPAGSAMSRQAGDELAGGTGSSAGRGRRALMLAVCCMSLFMVGLDNTIVNVGLPSIGRDLHAGVSGLQWTIAAYTIVARVLLNLDETITKE